MADKEIEEIKRNIINIYEKVNKELPAEKELNKQSKIIYLLESLKEGTEKSYKDDDDAIADKIKSMNLFEFYKEIATSLAGQSLDELLQETNSKKLNNLEIEQLESIRPKTHIIPNNKLAKVITDKNTPYNQMFELEVIKTKKKEVINTVTINYEDENIGLQTDKRLTPYDRAVHNAVCSLLEAGNTNFTPDQVYRCMNGMDNTVKVSPQSVGAVTRSIDKSRKIYAIVDYTNEAKSYNKITNDIDRLTQENYILSAKKTKLEAGGHVVVGYKINDKPLLYEYAQVTGQVLSVPSELLQTHHVIRSTPDVIVIREYLIRRIEQMKHARNKNHSNKIKFDTIHAEIGESNIHKKKASTVRKSIHKLLTLWKESKYITDFKFYKRGRSFHGIEIYYHKNTK